MYYGNNNYNYPTMPPLYPMDPCRPLHHMPHYMPNYMSTPNYMPMCPMMDPSFRDCVKICMMQCGYNIEPIEYPMDIGYESTYEIDEYQSQPYFPEELK
ncbi:MAG: hypothetical protein GX023_00090 [Tissierellia bacterium]|nr:hypothetical protein [Tissierellia bacterium]